MDIRQVILSNIKGSSKEEIRSFIQDAVNEREEMALPGMGILFEAMWEKRDENQKDTLAGWIKESV
ncbi:MAG TPA: small acid-soluble spore protein SspI [Thermoanaerobacterales bacterium]|nr:small acid-soluble spore protein SspI [Thermoanaerobacterales bacterium]